MGGLGGSEWDVCRAEPGAPRGLTPTPGAQMLCCGPRLPFYLPVFQIWGRVGLIAGTPRPEDGLGAPLSELRKGWVWGRRRPSAPEALDVQGGVWPPSDGAV